MTILSRIAPGALAVVCFPLMLLAGSLITRDDFVCYDTLESYHSEAMFPYITLDGNGLLYQVNILKDLKAYQYTRFDEYGNQLQPAIAFSPDTIRDTIWFANSWIQITVNESGRAFIPYRLFTNKPSGLSLGRIFGKLTDQAGNYLEEPEICFSCDLPELADNHYRSFPVGCINSNSVVGVTWHEQVYSPSYGLDWIVRARLYFPDSDSLGPHLVPSDLTHPLSNDPNFVECSYERPPAIAIADDGSFVIVWTVIVKRHNDMNQVVYGGKHVFFVIYDADCTPRTDVLIADCDGDFYDTSLCVTLKPNYVWVDVESDGDFYIAWTSASDDFSGYQEARELWMRGFTSEGVPKYFPVKVQDTETLNLDFNLINHPSISCDDSGNVLVTWSDSRHHSGSSYENIKRDMFAQKIDPDGNLIGPNYRINNLTGFVDPFGISSRGQVNNAGQAVFTMYYQFGGDYRVYAQLMPYHEVGTFVPGDLNLDFSADISDLTFMIDYLFISQSGRFWPPNLLDLNGDSANGDIADLIYIVRYLFLGGEEPVAPDAGARPNPGTYIGNDKIAGDIIMPSHPADTDVEINTFYIE